MGAAFIIFFGTADKQIVSDIASAHKLDKGLVEKEYAKMLEALGVEVKKEVK